MNPDKSPTQKLAEACLALASRMMPDVIGVVVVVMRSNDVEGAAQGVEQRGVEMAGHMRKFANVLEDEARRRSPLVILGRG